MNTLPEATVKKLQRMAVGIFAIPLVISICSNLLTMVGFAPSEWVSNEDLPTYKYIMGIFSASTTLIAYVLLSIIATNRTTSTLMRNVGLSLAIIGVVRTLFYFFYTGEGWTNIGVQLINMAFYWVPMLIVFYMLGTLERNNPNHLQTKKAALIIFWIGYIVPLFLVQAVTMLFIEYPSLYYLYHITVDGLLLFGYYLLMTSEAFSGRTDNSHAPKGAFKVWNRYFKYFLWSLLAMGIVGFMYLIVTETLLK